MIETNVRIYISLPFSISFKSCEVCGGKLMIGSIREEGKTQLNMSSIRCRGCGTEYEGDIVLTRKVHKLPNNKL